MSRRVKVADLLGEPLELEMPDGTVHTVQTLGVDDMMRMFALEGRMAEERESSKEAAEEQARSLIETRDFVIDMIRRENPGAFETDGVLVRPNWSPQAVMALLASLSGNDSVAASIREAIVGSPDEEAEQRAAEEARRLEAEQRGEPPPAEDGVPLDSTRPSQTPSSNSDDATDGPPSGGGTPDAPGEPSAHTSDTYAAHV